MTIALFCIFLAAVIPFVCAGISKAGSFNKHPRDGGYDNRNPRDWITQQSGYRKWADAAQANSFEALPFFTAAVIVNHMLGGAGVVANALAAAFIVLRAIYVWLYVTGRQAARSTVWTIALMVNVAIFFLTIFK
jgi:uncharacterized MAPEG superfamily protein